MPKDDTRFVAYLLTVTALSLAAAIVSWRLLQPFPRPQGPLGASRGVSAVRKRFRARQTSSGISYPPLKGTHLARAPRSGDELKEGTGANYH
jgi:hypothetical protein